MLKATDETLMAIYQDHYNERQEDAFKILYQRYSGKVYGYLSKRLFDRSLLDDVFQAAFLKLHNSRDRYNPTFLFAPWLFTICREVMIDALRSRKRVADHEQMDENFVFQAPQPIVPEAVQIPDLAQLSADQRQAIEFRYHQEMTFEEIAARLNTSAPNIRQLISRAVRKLQNSQNRRRQ